MRLTAFGEKARVLRMRCDTSLKAMAEAMGISSAHLSSIEYGEKSLLDKHIKLALDFFTGRVAASDLEELLEAAERSKEVVNIKNLSSDERGLVAAFARKLQGGAEPSDEILQWLHDRRSTNKGDV
ncbi:MAG: hypothetical protein ACK4KV_22105 [Rhodocyclaceae bacterium]